MNHQQILKKLAADGLVEAISDDVAMLTAWHMLGPKAIAHATISHHVISRLLRRWNCVLEAQDDQVSPTYRQKSALAIAVVLHKHGFQDAVITQKAIDAIEQLNASVALSDAFHRQSEEIKTFIQVIPKPLARRPTQAKDVTFWRAGDVAAVHLEGIYYALYVHYIRGANVAPIVEVYDFASNTMPTIDQVVCAPAKGRVFNDGLVRAEHWSIRAMKSVPDPAHQFRLLASGVAKGPDNSQLGKPLGLFVVSDLFHAQQELMALFGHVKTV